MLVALNENDEVINLLDGIPEHQKFFCPACKSELLLKCGPVKIPHFAHIALQLCDVWSENESVQHLKLKKAVYDWASSQEKIEVEKYLSELNQTPDILVNDKIVIEIQCSRLSIKRLRERTENYRRHGYYVLWLMGQNLWLGRILSPLQKQLLYFSQNLGFYYWELDLSGKCLRLKYLIHVSLKGELKYLQKIFPFSCGKFLEVLIFPFQSQTLVFLPAENDKHINRYFQRELFYRNPKWLEVQKSFYLQGKNLMTEKIQNQWMPPGLNLLTGEIEDNFLEVRADLKSYYRNFQSYYAKNVQTKLYPPAVYSLLMKKEAKDY